ncbi:MAG: hypothetical protein ABJQ29_06975 [Luteolibacter sp.]
MKTKLILTLACAVLSVVSCEKKQTEATESSAVAKPSLEKFFSEEAIADAEAIHLVKAKAKPGDEVVLSGQVMGREKVFVDGRASFILGDPEKLTSCDRIPGDACSTPWDACCDAKELKLENTASIQIVGENGRVLEGGLKGVNGLEELSHVTIRGVVAAQSSAESLLVNATQIHVSEE